MRFFSGVFCFALLLIAGGCKGQQNRVDFPLTEGRFLIPYRVDQKLGLADEAGKILVEPRFTYLIECYPERFVGFDAKGKALALFDICGNPKPLNSFKPDDTVVQEWITNKAVPGTFAYSSCNMDTTGDEWMNYGDAPYKLVDKPRDQWKYYGDNYHLADLEGNILMRDIFGADGVEEINRWLFILRRKEAAKGGTAGNFLYNFKQKKIVLNIPHSSNQRLDREDGFPVIKDAQGLKIDYYDADGREIAHYDTGSMRSEPLDLGSWNYRQRFTLSHSRERGGATIKYLAIRSTVKKPFRIYRAADLSLVDTTLMGIEQYIGEEAHYFSAMRNGKWGLLDADLKVALPFLYDTVVSVPYDGIVYARENGEWHYLNLNTGKKIPTPSDVLSPYSVNGLWLKVRYDPRSIANQRYSQARPIVEMLYLIDSAAQIRDSLAVDNHRQDHNYYLMCNGNVLQVPNSRDDELRSGRLGSEVQFLSLGKSQHKMLSYELEGIIYANGQPLLLKIISKGKPGLLAASDFRVLVAPGSCEYHDARPMRLPSCDKSGAGLWGAWITTYIKDGDEEKHKRAVGFYGATGRAYWKD